MKYSEFKDVVEKIGFSVSESTKIWIFVTNGSGLVVARVSRKEAFIFDTAYESFCLISEPAQKLALYTLCRNLAETPLAEREEEKRYWLRYNVQSLIVWGCSKNPRWLHVVRHSGYSFLCEDRTDHENVQTIFTESEIAQMDITGFEKDEVEE